MSSRMMPFQLPWAKILVAGVTIIVTSEIASHLLKRHSPKKKKPNKPVKKFKIPPWAASKMRAGELVPSTISEEQLAALSVRKPPELWNTTLIFPNKFYKKVYNSAIQQLIHYFDEARVSIYLCVYLNSHHDLTDLIRKKYKEGLLIHVVTDYDTWTAHNNSGTKKWKKQGIEVRLKNNGYLMHNKYAIIDEEAVLTGSLNWTRQGVDNNKENVPVTTDQRIVSKYLKNFCLLWNASETVD